MTDEYWYYYNNDHSKSKEGHFKNGLKEKWWIFYSDTLDVMEKCQFKSDNKNGYCLKYKNKKIVKAQRFKNGFKEGEWTDLKSFKKENKK